MFNEFEPYPNAGVTLRCPNEPENKEELLTSPERHEVFTQDFRVTMTRSLINNGRQWGFDKPQESARDHEVLGPIVCETCGARPEIEPWDRPVVYKVGDRAPHAQEE